MLPNVGRGRPRVYCSPSCRVRAHRRRNVMPAEMTARPRWVRWRSWKRDGRVTKLPIQVTGTMASSTDPGTWSTYGEALASSSGTGLGFMLGDGIGCIDLDHCIDDDGNLSDLARDVLAVCPPTFVELSQSGRGLHIFGLMPEAPGRNRGGVEVYSKARFIAMTGNRYKGSPSVLADLAEIRSMLI